MQLWKCILPEKRLLDYVRFFHRSWKTLNGFSIDCDRFKEMRMNSISNLIGKIEEENLFLKICFRVWLGIRFISSKWNEWPLISSHSYLFLIQLGKNHWNFSVAFILQNLILLWMYIWHKSGGPFPFFMLLLECEKISEIVSMKKFSPSLLIGCFTPHELFEGFL